MKAPIVKNGNQIAGVSAILLFVLMFFDWFSVKLSNNSNLLFAIQGEGAAKNAWEGLDYIPAVLLIAIIAALLAAALRLTGAVRRGFVVLNLLVAVLGLVSIALIAFRIFSPPDFGGEGAISLEGVVRWPVFAALLAGCGIAYGGYRAAQEERVLRDTD